MYARRSTSLYTKAHTKPGDIAVLSPYLPDSLKFSLSQKLLELDIPFLSSRPSRTLAEEPITRAVLAFAKAAHPQWKLEITGEELRHASMSFFPTCDIIRASLLAQNTLKTGSKLEHFYAIPLFTRERITNEIGIQFDAVLDWIEEYQKNESLPLYCLSGWFRGAAFHPVRAPAYEYLRLADQSDPILRISPMFNSCKECIRCQ